MGVATSKLMLEVLAARQNVRSPSSQDGGTVWREYQCLVDDRGAVGAGIGSLPAMGVEEVAMEYTANLESA